MRRIATRVASAVGAAMILAGSPVGARAQQPAARPRAEAQWRGRRAAARQMARWQMAHPRLALAWRRGYARGYVAARHPMLAARWRQAHYGRVARGRLYGRFLERRRRGRMGGRWSI